MSSSKGKGKSGRGGDASELRKRAERRLRETGEREAGELTLGEANKLLHELRVHQIELEMQNEELRSAQVEIEESRLKYSDLYDFAPVGYLTMDKKGLILEANLTACAQLEIERKFAIKKPLFSFVIASDANRLYKHLKTVVEDDNMETLELKLKSRKGREFHGLLKSIPWREAEGNCLCRSSLMDITEKKLTEEALAESEDRYRAIFDQARDGIVLMDFDTGSIVNCNAEFERQTGRKLEKLRTMKIWDLRPQDHVEAAKRKFSELRTEGEAESSDLGFLRLDGDIMPIDFISKAITIRGERCILGITRDITERKRAEEVLRKAHDERGVLLREIHHRVKNNLAVISGLLAMQSKHVKEKKYRDMFEDAQQRIKSISKIHKRLYQTDDMASIPMRSYLNGLAQDLFSVYGKAGKKTKLILDVSDDLRLGLDNAIPCALIINELLSNSLKYAFPNKRKGEIRVSLHGVGKNGYELAVSDNGMGLPEGLEFGKTDTLGLHLVTILSGQLKGKISLDSKHGTEFLIKFKAVHQ
jgi:PAS domain S-box-containing protein